MMQKREEIRRASSEPKRKCESPFPPFVPISVPNSPLFSRAGDQTKLKPRQCSTPTPISSEGAEKLEFSRGDYYGWNCSAAKKVVVSGSVPQTTRSLDEFELEEGSQCSYDDLPLLAADKITVGDVCGRGGFARVRKGVYYGHPVALKTAYSYSTAESIQREARICSLLHHPGIAEFYGRCLLPDGLSIVMQYCAGGSLVNLLSKAEIPFSAALKWSVEIADAMHYLHTQVREEPILHCDLKSANGKPYRRSAKLLYVGRLQPCAM